ncbi:MAG TPA: FeoA family protein [bacterium]|nr:FeoA family protein [bacterium]
MRHDHGAPQHFGRHHGFGRVVERRPGEALFIEDLAPGDAFEVVAVYGGRMARQRLCELGLAPGVRAVVEEIYPLIISIGDTRLALGRGLARKVDVRRVD